MRILKLLFFLFVIGLIVSSLVGKNTKKHAEEKYAVQTRSAVNKKPTKPQKIKKQKIDYEKLIDPAAITKYTPQYYPKTVKKFGPRLEEIEKFKKEAALKALKSGKCDYVELVELSTKSTLDNLIFWVDCRNGHRIYLSEDDLKNKKSKVFTQEERAIPRTQAIQWCKRAILNRLNYPSTAKFHLITGTAYYLNKQTGNVVVTMDFEAKNAFNLEFKYRGTCFISPEGKLELRLQERTN